MGSLPGIVELRGRIFFILFFKKLLTSFFLCLADPEIARSGFSDIEYDYIGNVGR